MRLGDFQVENYNSDGSVIIRWTDKKLNKSFAHVLKDPNELFSGLLDKIFYHRDRCLSMILRWEKDPSEFLMSQDGDILNPETNPKWMEEPEIPLSKRTGASHIQVFSWDVASFVFAYNCYFKTNVSVEEILPSALAAVHPSLQAIPGR